MEQLVSLDGNTISPSEVMAIASGKARVELTEDAWSRIIRSRKVIDNILSSEEVVYGINTGFGSLVDTIIPPDQLQKLQVNLIRSHATGLGEKMDKDAVRAMMVARINSFAKGYSGIHPNVVQQLIDFVNLEITPYIPRIGSLGASGDLAPLSHMALALIGEGKIIDDQGNLLDTIDVLTDKGLIPVELQAKDGLSLINGTSQMLSYSILSLEILNSLLPLADIIYGASLDAFQGTLTPTDIRIHNARPHPGQSTVANRMREIMNGSDILSSHRDCDRVQDPYSFRCAPQVHGAVYEALTSMQSTIYIELNSTTDNPLVFPDSTNEQQVVSQGNFHGEILALCADRMSLSLFELGSISERRMDQLLDSKKSKLPPFLTSNSGLESGLMIVQYSAGASLAELHGHAAPRTSFSTSTSAGQEDHVSMGATSCWNLYQACHRMSEVLACELLIAVEALSHNNKSSSPVVESLVKLTRGVAPKLTKDRSTSDELNIIATCLRDGSWLSRIEAENFRLSR
ncbi:MAG: histidine ammonia-lyase [Candidatus Thermoplasmatota archaeon]|nr:histidine ammonia-lyase [Candidatus Thermoplasmatota archaeon]